jgi:hypothetical protein
MNHDRWLLVSIAGCLCSFEISGISCSVWNISGGVVGTCFLYGTFLVEILVFIVSIGLSSLHTLCRLRHTSLNPDS